MHKRRGGSVYRLRTLSNFLHLLTNCNIAYRRGLHSAVARCPLPRSVAQGGGVEGGWLAGGGVGLTGRGKANCMTPETTTPVEYDAADVPGVG